MNKQAFTFLTLFSLILVLSIYYIMLPPVQDKDSVAKTQLSPFQQLPVQLDKKREDIINKNNQIIAKESSTSDSINEALETISETKSLTEKEKTIISQLKEMKYSEVYVEIDNQTIKITALKKDANQKDASSIISKVLQIVGDNYQVEVKFVGE